MSNCLMIKCLVACLINKKKYCKEITNFKSLYNVKYFKEMKHLKSLQKAEACLEPKRASTMGFLVNILKNLLFSQ